MMDYNTVAKETNYLQNFLRTCKEDGMKYYFKGPTVKDADRLVVLEDKCQKGANLRYLERECGFALIPCVFWCEKLIQFFIDRGADVNSRDENGDTALHLALRRCSEPIRPMKEIFHIGNRNTTALELRLRRFRPCSEPSMKDTCPYNNPVNVIKFLLDQSADPNIKNLRGENACFALANGRLWTVEKNYATKLAHLFRERGVDMEIKNTDRESILHIIQFWRHDKNPFIELYLGDIDIRNSSWLYSQTPLMCAARWGDYESCRILIEKGASVKAADLQGYTALHYSVLEGSMHHGQECVQLLLESGADPEAKSISGRTVYDLDAFKSRKTNEITKSASPSRQVKIYEMAIAEEIMKNLTVKDESLINCIRELWQRAMDVCKEFNLQPSLDFSFNYDFIEQNPGAHDIIYIYAMKTIVRLSESEMSKFWNLFSFAPSREFQDRRNPSYFFRTLNFLSSELKRNFGDFASFEIADFKSLWYVVKYFSNWLMNLVESGSKSEANPQRISHLHSIANLTIACFGKLVQETESNKVSDCCINIYVTLCHILTSLHCRFNDVMTETAFNENKGLLKKLIKLDLRDRDSNSLMHRIIRNNILESDFLGVLVGLVGDVTTRNEMGFEPIQYAYWKSSTAEGPFIEMAERGAHVDARNVQSLQPTLRKELEKMERKDLLFRYDTLKCACARVLVKNLVPYANRVPQKIVDFIRMH